MGFLHQSNKNQDAILYNTHIVFTVHVDYVYMHESSISKAAPFGYRASTEATRSPQQNRLHPNGHRTDGTAQVATEGENFEYSSTAQTVHV